ncbi:MAG: hypothetical protein ACKO4Y_03080 [Flavobacteriales bacterium]
MWSRLLIVFFLFAFVGQLKVSYTVDKKSAKDLEVTLTDNSSLQNVYKLDI